MNSYKIAFRLAASFIAVFGVMALALTACGSTSNYYAPWGTKTGTFRYCAYTAEDNGIHVDEHQSVPCLVNDVREADHRGYHSHTTYKPTPKSTKRTGGSLWKPKPSKSKKKY